MDIVGLIVRTLPANEQAITPRLLAIAGLEIHHSTSHGRLIVTIEQSTHRQMKSALDALETVEHLLSTSMVYQYSDETGVTTQASNSIATSNTENQA